MTKQRRATVSCHEAGFGMSKEFGRPSLPPFIGLNIKQDLCQEKLPGFRLRQAPQLTKK